MISVLTFTVVGSYIASLLPAATMGSFSVFMTFLLGIKFIVRPVMTTKEAMQGVSAKKRAIQSASMPRHFCALQHNSTDTKQLRYSPTRQYRLPPPPTYATHIIALRSFANVFFSIRDMATWLRPSTSATCFCVLSCI